MELLNIGACVKGVGTDYWTTNFDPWLPSILQSSLQAQNTDPPMWRPGGSDPVIYNNRERKEWGGGLIQALVVFGRWLSGEGRWRDHFLQSQGLPVRPRQSVGIIPHPKKWVTLLMAWRRGAPEIPFPSPCTLLPSYWKITALPWMFHAVFFLLPLLSLESRETVRCLVTTGAKVEMRYGYSYTGNACC
jgi:hypothetical protein